jgi:dipeptidase E
MADEKLNNVLPDLNPMRPGGRSPFFLLPIKLIASLVLWFGVVTASSAIPSFHTSPQASVLVCGGTMMNGDHFADSLLPAMREHYAGCRHLALILHASPPLERDAMELRLQKAFTHLLGDTLKIESLHHYDADGARALLRRVDGVFVGGGETFVLLGELQRQGGIEILRTRILAGMPYGGASAGANVAGLDIGTTNDFPVAEIASREALGVFPAVINPHHPTPDVKGEFDARAGKIRGYLKFNPTSIVCAIGNTSIVRWHDGQAKLTVGRAWLYRQSGMRELVIGETITELNPKP